MNLRQSGVTIKIHLSLNKEAALKSLEDATLQLQKVSDLQDSMLMSMATTGMQVFSLLNTQLTSAQVDEFGTTTRSRDALLGQQLEEASKLAGEKRILAERAIPLLTQYTLSNTDSQENAHITQVIAVYKAKVAEVFSIEDSIKAPVGSLQPSPPSSSSVPDPHEELLSKAEKICAQKDEFSTFMAALQNKKYNLAFRKAVAVGSLPLVHMLEKYIAVLSINVNEPSSNGWTALDWLDDNKTLNKDIAAEIRRILKVHHAQNGTRVRTQAQEVSSYGRASSALYVQPFQPPQTKPVKSPEGDKKCTIQ
jgi:hypothetical protein